MLVGAAVFGRRSRCVVCMRGTPAATVTNHRGVSQGSVFAKMEITNEHERTVREQACSRTEVCVRVTESNEHERTPGVRERPPGPRHKLRPVRTVGTRLSTWCRARRAARKSLRSLRPAQSRPLMWTPARPPQLTITGDRCEILNHSSQRPVFLTTPPGRSAIPPMAKSNAHERTGSVREQSTV